MGDGAAFFRRRGQPSSYPPQTSGALTVELRRAGLVPAQSEIPHGHRPVFACRAHQRAAPVEYAQAGQVAVLRLPRGHGAVGEACRAQQREVLVRGDCDEAGFCAVHVEDVCFLGAGEAVRRDVGERVHGGWVVKFCDMHEG